MKKIAIVIDSLVGGGAERVMLTLASEFLAMGHNVTIFSLKQHVTYQIPEALKLVFPFAEYNVSVRGWFNRKKLAKMLTDAVNKAEQNGRFDMFLVNLYEAYRIVQACNFARCHYVIHNDFNSELAREAKMGPIKYFYMRKILRGLTGKRLIAVSKGISNALLTTHLFTPKQVSQIYNPTDHNFIQSMAAKPLTEKIPPKFILHVGRAAKAKRHDVLFKALQNVDKEYVLVCLSVSVKKLRKLSLRLNVEDRVVLPGFSDNPYQWMKHAAAVVLSSDFEGLPTVLIEAQVCGTPIVSTDCPFGPREIVGEEGITNLVPMRDPDALAGAINTVLARQSINMQSPLLPKLDKTSIANAYLALC